MDTYLETSSTTVSLNWRKLSKEIMRDILTKKEITGEFGGELSSEAVSTAGV